MFAKYFITQVLHFANSNLYKSKKNDTIWKDSSSQKPWKYLYLLFAPDKTIDLSKIVFNTESVSFCNYLRKMRQ